MKINRTQLGKNLYKRRHLVPNAVTVGNMFCGFLTIVYATSGRFEKAAIAIGFAILLDGLDGRVARRLNATSKFGVEFDSFSDLVSFGVGPAVLMYNWCFMQRADELGVLISFVYALCAASRLARFNIAEPNPKGFVGMPTPGAAGMVAAVINFMPRIEQSIGLVVFGMGLMLSLAYLMVSKVGFFKPKLHRRRGFGLLETLILGAGMACIWYNNQIGFLVLASLYCLSGPFGLLAKPFRREKPPEASGSSEEEKEGASKSEAPYITKVK